MDELFDDDNKSTSGVAQLVAKVMSILARTLPCGKKLLKIFVPVTAIAAWLFLILT